jgi:hypothetical protein
MSKINDCKRGAGGEVIGPCTSQIWPCATTGWHHSLAGLTTPSISLALQVRRCHFLSLSAASWCSVVFSTSLVAGSVKAVGRALFADPHILVTVPYRIGLPVSYSLCFALHHKGPRLHSFFRRSFHSGMIA